MNIQLLIIWTWLVSITTSSLMQFANQLREFKDVADNDYKIDIARYKRSQLKKAWLTFVPIINIIVAMRNTIHLNNIRHLSVDRLRNRGLLIPMTEDEKEAYNRNPTALNALDISNNNLRDINYKTSITFNDNKIYFEIKNKYFVIVKSTGPVSNLSTIMQWSKLRELLLSFHMLKKTDIQTDELIIKGKGFINIDISNKVEQKATRQTLDTISDKLSSDQQMKMLEELRIYLTELKNSLRNNSYVKK